MNNTKFDLNDILLVPEVVSDVYSRKEEVNARYADGYLPIFNAPMDRVINTKNEALLDANGINTVQVRGTYPTLDHTIRSMSLVEMVDAITDKNIDPNGRYLIDMANGHMYALMETAKAFKILYPDTFLMVGNVANPETYKKYAELGVDAVRLSIGTGGSCLTAVHTGIGYPLGSLISECRTIKKQNDYKTLIIADGGMKNYADIIKSLALGADYVMIGNLLNKTLESAGDSLLWGKIKVPQWLANEAYLRKIPIYKTMRGMSTIEVQKDWGKKQLTATEGTISKNKVEYATHEFISDFEQYLKSQMSYLGCRTLEEMIGEVQYNLITPSAYLRYMK